MGIITKTVKIKPRNNKVRQYYREKGYIFNDGDEIEVKVEDLQRNNCSNIYVFCDICKKEQWVKHNNYITSLNRGGYYACKNCINIKREDMIMKKYGVKSNLQIPEVRRSIEKTNLEKYGYKNVLQSPTIQEKIKQTNLERIGVENPFMLQKYQDKGKQTKIERYGTDNTSQLEETKIKAKETNLKNWGFKNPAQSPIIQAKMKETNLQRWGFEYASQSPIIQEKIQNTNMERFGYPVASKSPIIQEKIQNTNIEHFGVTNPMKSPIIKKKCAEALFISNAVKTSKQQIYLNNLFEGILNGVVGYYNCDIVLNEEKIIIEYNGSGHWLNVVLGGMTEDEYKKHEIVRNNIIKREGYKRIEITSRKDKLPSDEKLLEMLSYARSFFQENPQRSWINFDIDNSCIYNAYHKEDGEPYDYGTLRTIKKKDVEIAS